MTISDRSVPTMRTARSWRPGDLASPLWHALASLRLALTLIVTLAVLVFAGTLLDQAPPSVVSDPVAYEQWLGDAGAKYGAWAGTFDRLQLFNVFHSFYFRAVLGLLSTSIVVCTVSRWRGIWKTVFHTRVRATETFLTHARYNARIDTTMPAPETAERIRKSLSGAHYRVTSEGSAGSVALFADKNRLSRFGTFLTHLSLVLILVGAMAGGIWGFEDPRFTVAEGSTRELGLGTPLSVRLDEFADDYHADGSPRDYRGEVTLFDEGQPVKTSVLRVNSPMRYKGVAFHLSFFGQAAVMSVRDGSGREIFSGGVPLALQTRDGQRPVGSFDLPEQNLSVYVIGPRPGAADDRIRAGEVRMELYRDSVRVVSPVILSLREPMAVEGLTFTFEQESRFAGLKVVKDPGMNIIWVACAFMVAGLVMLFYLPRRRIWALCVERSDGGSEVLVGMPAQRDLSLTEEFDRLKARLARALELEPAHNESEGDLHG